MNKKKENSIKEIQTSVEKLLDTKATIRPKRLTKEDIEFEIFERIILNLEGLENRAKILEMEFEVNLNSFEK